MTRQFSWMLCVAACAAGAAAAQEAPSRVVNGQSFGAWTVSCEAVAVGETACVLNQQLIRTNDRAFLAQLLAIWSSDLEKRYLLARVPLGVYLPAGLAMRPEAAEGEDAVAQFTWQSCNANFCEALIEMDEDRLAAFVADDAPVIASYRPALNADPVVFRFSMAGMVSGMDAVRPKAADKSE